MKYFFNNIAEIEKKIKQHKKTALVFDFDGTLSKIAPTPNGAFIGDSIKDLLKKLSNIFYIAILSGRQINDLKQKVGIKGLTYAGNHGFEWQMENGKQGRIKISPSTIKNLSFTKQEFERLKSAYQGSLVEDKFFSVVLHYRNIPKKLKKKFLKETQNLVLSIKREKNLQIIKGKKAIEVRPNIKWNKGYFIKFLEKQLKKENKKTPLFFYIGDDATDEDAFLALKNSITIRIGRKQKSAAKYFINRSEVNKFLSLLLK